MKQKKIVRWGLLTAYWGLLSAYEISRLWDG